MICDDSVLDEKEIAGVLLTLDEKEHPIRWMFRDDDRGIKFVYYCNWLDELETEYSPLIKTIFDRFCENNNIVVEEIYMVRFTLLVQDKEEKVCLPEIAYPNPDKVFIYFASESDRPIYVGGHPITPKMGRCISFDYKDGYTFMPPLYDNFFLMVEIEYK